MYPCLYNKLKINITATNISRYLTVRAGDLVTGDDTTTGQVEGTITD